MGEQHQPTRTTKLLHLQQLLHAEVAEMFLAATGSPDEIAMAASCAFDVQKPVATWLLGAMAR